LYYINQDSIHLQSIPGLQKQIQEGINMKNLIANISQRKAAIAAPSLYPILFGKGLHFKL
jgi:hypothetical protein